MGFVREFEWDFTMPIADWERPYRVYAPKEEAWLVAFNTKDSPGLYPDGAPVFDENERKRLGRLGFVTAFNHRFGCDLREGRLRAALVEMYSDFQKTFQHPEEEFVFCLRGNVRVTVGEDHIDLQPGQSVTFWCTEPHTYGLTRPLEKNEEPALLLMVWTVGKAIRHDDAPVPKRRPRTPKALKNQPPLIKP